MKKSSLENYFETFKGEFDVEMPREGHELRFIDKLKHVQTKISENKASKRKKWYPFVGIAASITLIIALVISVPFEKNVGNLATISPEMEKTQDFFVATINTELKKLEANASPETENLVNDAIKQIATLEKAYEILQKDLAESGNDERVIYAMISNYQNRIDILRQTLENIKMVKDLRNNTNILKTSNI